jgi:hypothetical protein
MNRFHWGARIRPFEHIFRDVMRRLAWDALGVVDSAEQLSTGMTRS